MDAETWYRVGSVFDGLAAQYDKLWTSSAVGRLQRQAVWRSMDRFFRSGDKLIDLGCGTGEDALHLARQGMQMFAIDASPEMVRIARGRGVNASVLGIEEVGCIQGSFDGAISNFGALNCVSNLEILRGMLGRLVNPGGYLAVCTLGRFCLWETLWYLLRGHPRKAFRRAHSRSLSTSLCIPVRHFSIRQLSRAFRPEFSLIEWRGIGLSVPPSYVTPLPDWVYHVFDGIDRGLAHWPLLRALADHRLAIFVRNRAS